MNPNNQQQSEFLPELRIGKIGVLKVHQISDEELTKLEQGAGQSLLLNFGVATLALAVGIVPTLLTTDPSPRAFIVLVIAAIGGGLAGIVLLVLWWSTHRPIRNLVREIRGRMPPEGEAQPLPLTSNLPPVNGAIQGPEKES